MDGPNIHFLYPASNWSSQRAWSTSEYVKQQQAKAREERRLRRIARLQEK